MITSTSRGWKIYFDGNIWRYVDTNQALDEDRPCKKCGKRPMVDGTDACLGYIDGAVSACCGHGIEEPYIIWKSEEMQ